MEFSHPWKTPPTPVPRRVRTGNGMLAGGVLGAVIGATVGGGEESPVAHWSMISSSVGCALGARLYLKFEQGLRLPWARELSKLVLVPLIFGVVCALMGALVAALPVAFAIVEMTVPLALNALIQGWSPEIPVPRIVLAPLCAAVVRAVAGLPSPS
jgi:hypothetical protein